MIHTVFTGAATILIVLVYFWTYAKCGMARGKYKIAAPATTGHIEFEKAYRVQMNTLEALPMILPTMWIFALTGQDLYAGLCGLVFALGRIVYGLGYYDQPEKRGTGTMIGFIASVVALIGAIYGLVMSATVI